MGAHRPGPGADRGAVDRRERNRALLRDGLVAVTMIAVVATTWVVRTTPNPDHPLAVELTGRLDEAYREIRSGELALAETPTEVADGITGARLDRTVGDPRWALTGSAGGECYLLWWDPDGLRRARTLRSTVPCEPTLTATASDPDVFARVGRGVPEDAARSPWEGVLPDREQMRVWVLPVMIVGGGVMLSALVRVTVALLTGRAPSYSRR